MKVIHRNYFILHPFPFDFGAIVILNVCMTEKFLLLILNSVHSESTCAILSFTIPKKKKLY